MYRYKRTQGNQPPTEEELNRLAEDGWELLQILTDANGDLYWSYFRQSSDAQISA